MVLINTSQDYVNGYNNGYLRGLSKVMYFLDNETAQRINKRLAEETPDASEVFRLRGIDNR